MADSLTVVIPTAGRTELLRRTLDSLVACPKPANYRGVLVVENGPKHGQEPVVAEYAASLSARYLYSPTPNKCRALNLALQHVDESAIVFFTDDDVRFHPDVLYAYTDAAAAVSRGKLFGGPVDADCVDAPPAWLEPYLPLSARSWRLEVAEPTRVRSPAFLGYNWAAFASDLKAIGGFDEQLGPGTSLGVGDEDDAQLRLVRSGVEAWYLPKPLVWHYVPRERCMPHWVLERTYRTGIGTVHAKVQSWKIPLLIPPALCRLALAEVWALGTSIRPRSRLHFSAAFYRQKWRGILRGIIDRAAVRQPPTTATAPGDPN